MVEPETAGLGRFLDKWLETSVKPRGRSKDGGDYEKLPKRSDSFWKPQTTIGGTMFAVAVTT